MCVATWSRGGCHILSTKARALQHSVSRLQKTRNKKWFTKEIPNVNELLLASVLLKSADRRPSFTMSVKPRKRLRSVPGSLHGVHLRDTEQVLS